MIKKKHREQFYEKSDMQRSSVIILGAGLGKRMNSSKPKILHEIAGRPMVFYSLENVRGAGLSDIVLVVGHEAEEVMGRVGNICKFAPQRKQIGTADAVKAGIKKIDNNSKNILVLNGDDSAFYEPHFLKKILDSHAKSKRVFTVVTSKVDDPTGLGRIKRDKDGEVVADIEEKVATGQEKKMKEVNAGIYVFNKIWLSKYIAKVKKSPVGEYFLTDLVGIAVSSGFPINAYQADELPWRGVNNLIELSESDRAMKKVLGDKMKKIHIMGISGSGASAAAGLLEMMGHDITGCDKAGISKYSQNLKNIPIAGRHDPLHLRDIDLLLVSPAILAFDRNNPEILEAKKKKIKISTWDKYIADFLLPSKFVIAVSGTHGKSTTSAMVAQIIKDFGLSPSALVGASVPAWRANFLYGKGLIFVIEADEYNDKFLNLKPDILVITNIEWDHPEYFKNLNAVEKSFAKLANKVRPGGFIVAFGKDKGVKRVVLSAGENKKFRFFDRVNLKLKLIGDFHRQNTAAALTVAAILGIPEGFARKVLSNFETLGRRLEFVGKKDGVLVYDDYAVHPTEVLVTLNALKRKYPKKRVVCVFQPHLYSRFFSLKSEFVRAIGSVEVDEILVTDVYAAREKPSKLISAKSFTREVGRTNVVYSGDLDETYQKVARDLKQNCVLVTMGAGDVYEIGLKFLENK